MKNPLEHLQVQGSKFQISLSKLTGVTIADITGHISRDFGEPVFKLSCVKFSDGSEVWVEGEHDLPYIADELPNTPKSELNEVRDAMDAS